MEIAFEPINGICFGFEYVPPDDPEDLEEDEYPVSTLLLDLVLLRVIIQW